MSDIGFKNFEDSYRWSIKRLFKKKIHKDKNIYKYEQHNKFHHDHQLLVYTYDYLYVYTEKILMKDYLQLQKHLLITTRKV